jgi:hypothetical protein
MILMGKRLLTYIAVLFFSVSSLMFACPEVYSLSKNQHTVSNGLMPNAEPCHETDHQPPHSVCYRVLHDRLFSPATISGPLGGQGSLLAAFVDSVLSVPVFSAQLSAWRSKSPPKLALTVLFPVLRI